MEDAEDRGYKEGEATYILQCEAAKDIFFNCGWKRATAQLGHGSEPEVFLNPPPHFIPSYMAEYAPAIQQKFLEVEDDEEESEPNNAPVVNDPAVESARVAPPVEDLADNMTELRHGCLPPTFKKYILSNFVLLDISGSALLVTAVFRVFYLLL